MKKTNSFKLSLTVVLTLFLFVGMSFSTLAATGITVTYPNGGEYLNDEADITWSVTGSVNTDRFDVRYSNNSGVTWSTAAPRLYFIARSFTWDTTSVTDSSNFLIQIVESATSSADDVSDSTFTVDNTIPTSSITSPDASLWQGEDFAVSRTDADIGGSGLATCEVRILDNAVESLAWTTATCNADYTVDISSYCTTEGTDMCEVQIRSTDQAGNPSAEYTRTFSIDSVSPSTTDDYVLTGWQTSDQTITLTPSDAAPGSGIAWTRYCIDSLDTCNPASGTDYTASVLVSTEETNYFRYATQDNAGNVETTVSETVMIDKTNPTASVSGAPLGLIIDPIGVTATVECLDALSGCNTLSYASYRVELSDPGTCSTNPLNYIYGSSVLVTGHSWVCSYVEDNAGNADVSDPTEFNVFSTIQGAINAATGGETINVPASSYPESLTIDKSLTLQGAGSSTAIINGVHTITASDVTIDGFTLAPVGSGIAVTIDSSSSAINNVDITNNIFTLTTSPSIGVWLGGGTPTNLVSDIIMNYNTFNGPTDKICNPWKIGGAHNSPLSIEVEDLTFDGNIVNRCSIPINLQDADISNVVINDNVFRNTDGVVYVWTQEGSSPTGSLSGFEFTNNDVDSTNTYGVGIFSNAMSPNSNEFTDANFWIGNKINYNKFVGISGGYGLKSVSLLKQAGTYELNATFNWWGTSDETLIQGNVSTNVDFTPWAYNTNFDYELENPTTVINSPTNSSWQGGVPSFDVSLSDSDTGGSDLSLCRYRVRSFDGAIWSVTKYLGDRTCSASVSLLVGSDPSNYCEEEGQNACKIEAFAIDVAGNTGDTVSQFFSIDWTAPTTTDSGTDTSWHASDVTVTLTPTDGSGSGVANTYYCVDQTGTCDPTISGTPYTAPIVISTEGTNYIKFYSVDNAGNAETVQSATNTVMIDKSSSTITDVNPGNIEISSGVSTLISANVTDSYSGINRVDLYYTYPNATVKILTMSNVGDIYSATIPAQDASTVLTYKIAPVDNVANTGNSADYTITVKDLVWNLDNEWNLVSVPKTLSVNDVGVLIPANTTLWNYNANTGTWGTPLTIDPGVGYWVDNSSLTELGLDYSNDCNGPLCGPSETITLGQGWNLIGHMCTNAQNVTVAVPPESYDNLFVLRYEETTNSFEIYATQDPESAGFTQMVPGEGYWVFVPEGDLVYTNVC